jgi:hypothetical protein
MTVVRSPRKNCSRNNDIAGRCLRKWRIAAPTKERIHDAAWWLVTSRMSYSVFGSSPDGGRTSGPEGNGDLMSGPIRYLRCDSQDIQNSTETDPRADSLESLALVPVFSQQKFTLLILVWSKMEQRGNVFNRQNEEQRPSGFWWVRTSFLDVWSVLKASACRAFFQALWIVAGKGRRSLNREDGRQKFTK